ncbi:MAG: tktB protein [Candidatus Parcubacteria bacterium]|jgi:transketolase
MQLLTQEKEQFLTNMATTIREDIIQMLLTAASGHTAGPLDMADIFALLYFHVMKHDPKNPHWKERDMMVLSNGHICPVQYATMARAGYFPVEELQTLRKFGSRLQGHPHREWLPGIDVSSGPLGSGLAQAVGMALADRVDQGHLSQKFIYCLTGDGELNCGIIWEAAMLAGKERLHNLIVIIDRNGIQIDGYVHDIMPLEPLREKWESFGWHVQDADGHSFREMYDAIGRAQSTLTQPSVIIAHTIAGKGVPQFERDYHWHGMPPNKEQADMALRALRSLGGQVEATHHD